MLWCWCDSMWFASESMETDSIANCSVCVNIHLNSFNQIIGFKWIITCSRLLWAHKFYLRYTPPLACVFSLLSPPPLSLSRLYIIRVVIISTPESIWNANWTESDDQLRLEAEGCCFWHKHVKMFIQQHSRLFREHWNLTPHTFWHCCDFRRKSLNVNSRYDQDERKSRSLFRVALLWRNCVIVQQKKTVRSIFTIQLVMQIVEFCFEIELFEYRKILIWFRIQRM